MTNESRTSSEGWGLLKNRRAMTLLLAGLAAQAVALTLGGALKVLVAGTGIALVLRPIRKSLSWTRWDAAAAVVGVATGAAFTAKLHGFEGDACPECGNFTMVRNGTCLKCTTCGSTTGCS